MRPTASPDRDREVLDLWERALGLDRWRRNDALLAEAGALRGLGARNAALLAVRNTLFDRAWPLRSRCPACAADCEFEVDSVALAGELRRTAEPAVPFDWAGRTVTARAPTVDDLQAISAEADQPSAVRALVARCVEGDLDLAAADNSALQELGQHLERLDPGAVVAFQLSCPACRRDWSATLDVGDALWSELTRSAERTLGEVDALARAYGWTEAEVMRLSPTRRAAYLQLVGSA